ncbi:MAG: transposase, partial [Proteobacteria bacterium]|nr:transposase [Pseudomonadota bacterium]
MPQVVLPFQYEIEKSESDSTSLAGLPIYLDLMIRAHLHESLNRHVGVRVGGQGWSDYEVVSSLVLLNLAGGECVDDLRVLEGDEGMRRLMDRVRHHGMRRKDRRELERRFRKDRERSVPSPSSVFRYLSEFHDPDQELVRPAQGAFIPSPNAYLGGFRWVNGDLAAFAQRQDLEELATLDMDATLVESGKSEARYCYKKFKGYQPLNTWWAEHELVLHTEFRDGNVPAGYEQLRVFREALELLPEGVQTVRL